MQAFMVIVWLVVEVLFLFFFFSMPDTPDPQAPSSLPQDGARTEEGVNTIQNPAITNSTKDTFQSQPPSYSEKSPLLSHKNPSVSDPAVRVIQEEQCPETEEVVMGRRKSWWRESCQGISWRVWELMREETVVLLVALFMTMFNQMAIEVC